MFDVLTLIVTKAFKSKTLIKEWAVFAAGLVAFVAGQDVIQEYPAVVAALTSAGAVIGMVIRALTYVSLEDK